MADPFDRVAVESLRVLTGRRIERRYCPEDELLPASQRVYGSSVARMIADLDSSPGGAPSDEEELAQQLQEMAREPSVVNLVNLIILEAIEARASDIHIEPFEKALKVKYRIDGLLHDMSPPPKQLQPAIASRIKIMAGMNIAERFVPQDGHIAFADPQGQDRPPRGDRAHDLRRKRGHAHPGPLHRPDRHGAAGPDPRPACNSSLACWSGRTASCWSPAPPAAARPPRCTPR